MFIQIFDRSIRFENSEAGGFLKMDRWNFFLHPRRPSHTHCDLVQGENFQNSDATHGSGKFNFKTEQLNKEKALDFILKI